MNLDFHVSRLSDKISILGISGDIKREVSGLAYDTRDVKEGYVFFALEGIHADGHDYIPKAIEKGAKVIFHTKEIPRTDNEVTYVRVKNSRTAMAPVSALFYNYPGNKLTCIGVTGTDGKSTTVSLIHQLLTLAGIKAGFISTVQFDTGGGAVKNHYRQSTPEATEIQKILAAMVENGCTHAVIEATSHGLSPINNRLGEITFSAGVLTNISHEHLEFHKTMDRYVDDKANLFRNINPSKGFGIVNFDEPYGPKFMEASKAPIKTYSIKNSEADLFADGIEQTSRGERFSLVWQGKEREAEIKLPGIFNIENTLAAILAVSTVCRKELFDLVPLLPRLQAVKGRMNYISMGQDFSLIVDYAHTPGAFKKLFPLLKNRKHEKLIAVFGSAGERDVKKRKILGEIADTFADIIILTDEDPRGEEPVKIIKDVAVGCTTKKPGTSLLIIPDRREAIQKAFNMAKKDDLVILLGKGHESTIIYNKKTIPWDEGEIAREILKKMGFNKKME